MSLSDPPPSDEAAEFERLIREAGNNEHYVLHLYVTGNTPRSRQAISNIRSLCEEYLQGRYDLKVIDIYQQPAEAGAGQIIAAPTLVKSSPNPPRRLVGDLSDRDRVLLGLNIRSAKPPSDQTKWITM